MPPESRFVTVDGAVIHDLDWGRRDCPGILLVHGNAAHAYWWSFVAPFLARDYHVAAMDLSGMGDSDWRPPHGEEGGYSMELFAREHRRCVKMPRMFTLAEPPVIVGHSFGGFVTMLTGGRYGERLKGTVILDSPVNPPMRGGSGEFGPAHAPAA